MRKVFVGLAILLMLAIVLQFLLAAGSAFDTAPKDESFGAHRAMGYAILLHAVVTTVVGALARVPARLVGMTGLVAVGVILMGVIRAVASAVGETATAGQLVFGLHGVTGLAIMALVVRVVRHARALSRPAATGGTADGTAAPAACPTRVAS